MSIDLNLSLHPDEIFKKSKLEMQLYSEELQQLPPLEEGKISIDIIYTVNWENIIEVGFYLRNATKDTISFSRIPLKLMTPNGKEYARQMFELSSIGDVPPYSARPWVVNFDKNNITLEDIPTTGWKIASVGDLDNWHGKVIEDQKPEPLNEEQLALLGKFLKGLAPVSDNKLNIDTFSIERKDNGELHVSLIIRHGLSRPLLLNRFPIKVMDAKDNCIAKAIFKIEPFRLEPKMFFLRTFTFDFDINYQDIDLSKYIVTFF